MSPQVRITVHTFLLYAATMTVGIAAAWRHAITPALTGVPRLEFTLANAVVFAAVFLGFTFVMVRFSRVAHASLSVFLLVALVAGTQFIVSPWVPVALGWVLALAVAAAPRLVPRVIVHDVAIILGIAGIAGILGLSVTPLVAAGLLALLSVYDIYSVYRSRAMVSLAGRMLQSGAVFGFLVPARLAGFLAPVRQALDARAVMLLGSGDIGLPLVLAASAVSTSIGSAVMVCAFALAGVLGMQWLFMHQDRPAPMAALPPIAASAVLGYVVAILLGI